MSSKQNKKQARKARKQETIELEKQLLKTQWPLECEALPMEDLSHEDQEIVQKCINQEKLNDTEFARLKKILVKYRPSIKKYEVNKTVKNTEKLIKIINTEKELIDLFENTNMTLKVHLPFNGQILEFIFELLPVKDSRIVKKLDTHLELFKDLNQKEKEVFNKAQAGLQVSREEQRVLDKLTQRLEEKATQKEAEIVDAVLENQVRLEGSTATFEERRKFWSYFPLTVKALIFTRVQDRIGLTDYKQEELFPVSE